MASRVAGVEDSTAASPINGERSLREAASIAAGSAAASAGA